MTKESDKQTALQLFESAFRDKVRAGVSQSKKVVSCTICEGTGFISREELSDYHRREYRTITNECVSCKGSGRRVEITTRFQFGAVYPYHDATSKSVDYVPYPDDPMTVPVEQVFNHGFILVQEKVS